MYTKLVLTRFSTALIHLTTIATLYFVLRGISYTHKLYRNVFSQTTLTSPYIGNMKKNIGIGTLRNYFKKCIITRVPNDLETTNQSFENSRFDYSRREEKEKILIQVGIILQKEGRNYFWRAKDLK